MDVCYTTVMCLLGAKRRKPYSLFCLLQGTTVVLTGNAIVPTTPAAFQVLTGNLCAATSGPAQVHAGLLVYIDM